MQTVHWKFVPQVFGKQLRESFRKQVAVMIYFVRNNQGKCVGISLLLTLVGATLKNTSTTIGCIFLIIGCIAMWATVLASIKET